MENSWTFAKDRAYCGRMKKISHSIYEIKTFPL